MCLRCIGRILQVTRVSPTLERPYTLAVPPAQTRAFIEPMLLFWTELSLKQAGGAYATVRWWTTLPEIVLLHGTRREWKSPTEKLKVVPIKGGGSVIVSSTTVHARAQNPKSFGAVNISYHCALTVQSAESSLHLLTSPIWCMRSANPPQLADSRREQPMTKVEMLTERYRLQVTRHEC